ncbi:hypothetical protein [Clostridium estertheticum]|uniref:hypothetical protein n=1 Tax=Clostridium estertheticum TaxID=238834 RepID=UPI001CF3B1C9|nr:hypothetical protein [Clostridium estertheticum]MCB2360025.1 hypothetical protein [Clostridium estertheticum]
MEYKMKESLRKYLITGILIALFLTYYNIKLVTGLEKSSIELLLVYNYGYLELSSIKYLIPIILWSIPQMYLIYSLKDTIASSLYRNSVYIFTRTNKRSFWILKEFKILFFHIIFYYGVQFITVISMGYILGLKFYPINKSLFIILILFILVCLTNYILILTINVLALKISLTYSFCIGILINICSVFSMGFINEVYPKWLSIIKIIPSSQSIINWHTNSLVGFYNLLEIKEVQFCFSYSIGYLTLLCLILIGCGVYIFKNMDIV